MRKTNLINMGYFREYMLLNMKKALFTLTTLSDIKCLIKYYKNATTPPFPSAT